ncbi:MAG: VOC family protein [Thermoplasmata archaeon]
MTPAARLVTLMPIRNMDRAIKFYTRTLGAKLMYRGEGEMKDMWAGLKFGSADLWLIVPERREKRSLAYSNLLVKNIKTFVSALKKKGVKFERPETMGPQSRIEGPIVIDTFGAAALFKDSEGNLLMIWQNSPSM